MTITVLTVIVTILLVLVIALGAAVVLLWRAQNAMRFRDATARSVANALRAGDDEEAVAELLQYLEAVNERVNALGEHARELDGRVQTMRERMRSHLQRMGVVRFDASDDVSGRLSCALCVIDADGHGFLITALYDLERSRTFVRGIRGGRADRELLEPEQQALQMAVADAATPRPADRRAPAASQAPRQREAPAGAEAGEEAGATTELETAGEPAAGRVEASSETERGSGAVAADGPEAQDEAQAGEEPEAPGNA